jgi:hypothetical protein
MPAVMSNIGAWLPGVDESESSAMPRLVSVEPKSSGIERWNVPPDSVVST